jgi:glycine dehydrogenase
LAPFLPGSPLKQPAFNRVGPVAAAPWGSAGILPISWAYIYLMGDVGLRRASEAAVLSANYVAARLAPHYPVLYTGVHGRVAHECVIDVRPLKQAAAITVDDIAKRLIDYGFHAPTMSFPVPGTLMVEPTESESKAELDRFCAAMIQIREEIQAIEDGIWDCEDNPLKNAPHTAIAVTSDEWHHGYSRQVAAYPTPGLKNQKYWVPVGRIDQAYGDRNVMCACPAPKQYELEETNV